MENNPENTDEVVVRLRTKRESARCPRSNRDLLIVDENLPEESWRSMWLNAITWKALVHANLAFQPSPATVKYDATLDAAKVDELLAKKDEEIAVLIAQLEKDQSRASALTDVLGERDRTIANLKEQLEDEKILRLSTESAARKTRRMT